MTMQPGPDLIALALALLWQGVQYVLVSVPANRELGADITLAPRDDGPISEKVSLRTARLGRALDNHATALVLFAPAVFLVVVTGNQRPVTAGLAFTYLAARIAYVPAYALGWQPWRSILWMIGFLSTMALVVLSLI